MEGIQPYGYVYRITNKVNGRVYIGKHRLRNEPWRTYLGSGVILSRALRKYGRVNFTKAFLGYAWSAEELSSLEKIHISQLTGNHYNIQNSELNGSTTNELSSDTIITLYRSGRYSTNDLADMFHCAQPTIAGILKEHRDRYPELAHISQGRGIKPLVRSPEATEKMRATYRNKTRIQCSNCGGSFLTVHMEAHGKYCSSWPRCATCGARLSKRGAVHCRAHVHSRSRVDGSSASVQDAGKSPVEVRRNPRRAHGSHVRWHLSRGRHSPECSYCNEE